MIQTLAFLLIASLLLFADKVNELVVHEDNCRFIDLNTERKIWHNWNKLDSENQNMVHRGLTKVSMCLKALSGWGYEAIEIKLITQWK